MRTQRNYRNSFRPIEFALWATGILALGIVGYDWSRASFAQSRSTRELAELSLIPASHVTSNVKDGMVLARVEIPRLNLSAVIYEGTSEDTLAKGVGHLRGTSTLGGDSNIVLAAHRDTFFRPLRDVLGGDIITLIGPHRSERYQVTYTKVVTPDHVEVANPTATPVLTLITCYPFSFLGAAPERFVVRANQTWVSDF